MRTYAHVMAAPHWLFGTFLPYMLRGGFPEFEDMPEGERRFWGGSFSWAALADDFTWDDVRAIRKAWKGNLVLKGVSTAEDARVAAECGVDGIIVSNHGGRMLDGCIPSFLALPEIVDAVAPKVTVMVDGGFKRGADVLKAIATGASSVWVGRATLYGLAAGGEPGVARALAIFREEINRAMALLGCPTIAAIGREHIARG
jgi:isopentenyl diphosphate isomerase/L-lactate dehydrogenase-like FMN-dependent dehydrogenase